MKLVRLLAATALTLAMAPAVTAAASTTATEDIHFDGYCDGVQLTFDAIGPGTVSGTQTGCVADAIYGQSQASSFSKGTTWINDDPGGLMYVINKDQTWHIYALNGTDIMLLNSGTWSPGPPTRGKGTVASSAVRHASEKSAPSKKIKEISFDGYCDGLHFNIPSHGLGTKNTIDGYRTGCASDPLFGETGKVAGKGKGNIVAFKADGSLGIQAGVFNKGHVWVLYSTDGTSIYLLNSGTWTKGPPAKMAGLKPSV